MVGEEFEFLLQLLIAVRNAAEESIIVVGGVLGEDNDLIDSDTGTGCRGLVLPFGKLTPSDPTPHIADRTGAWDALRKRAGVAWRFLDLRHTAATKDGRGRGAGIENAGDPGAGLPAKSGALLPRPYGGEAGGGGVPDAAAGNRIFNPVPHKNPHNEAERADVVIR